MKIATSVSLPSVPRIEMGSTVETVNDLAAEKFQRNKEPVANSERGEIVLTAIEIGPVSDSPSEHGSEIIALHRHVIDEETCIPFMYWRGVEKYFRIRRKSGDWLYKFSVRE